ncbi:MAG: class I SAM-dependent methyltransferase [Planctomycetota bacterium]|nr:MAG: class I SAM-dependent methyltransferase [Planctomycetota bacterium]
MDRAKLSWIGHGDWLYWNPIEAGALEESLASLSLGASDQVLDVGCGKGAALLFLAERCGCRGLGVDLHRRAVAHAEEQARQRSLEKRLEFRIEAADPGEWPEAEFALALCLGASHALGGFEASLQVFHSKLKPGGWALIGEGYWKQNPAEEYLTFLGMQKEELKTFEETAETARRAGFEVLSGRPTSEPEWRRYEETYQRRVLQWAEDHPDDPQAAPFRRHILSWRRAYQLWGLKTLGFGLYLLRKPEA